MVKAIPNPDKSKYDEMTEAVKKNDGYCPCLVQKNEDTKCMCKMFREQVKAGKPGPCHCGRFVAVECFDIDVKIKLSEGGILPQRKTDGAAAYDCYANESVVIKPGERKLVPLGFALQIPEGYCAVIDPRSGLTKDGIDIGHGTIDCDYRGIVHACVINSSKKSQDYDSEGDFVETHNFIVKKGDRICQMKFEKLPSVKLSVVDELDPTERGTGGFGHTGLR